MKVDFLKFYVSTAAIFGIGILWFQFNKKVFYTVCDPIKAPFIETDSPESDWDSEVNSEVTHWVRESQWYEAYRAEEPRYKQYPAEELGYFDYEDEKSLYACGPWCVNDSANEIK